MRTRYLVLIIFMVGAFGARLGYAHPPSLHEDSPQEQTLPKDTVKQSNHDEQVTSNHHEDDAGAAEHNHEDIAHDEASDEASGHSHWGISPDSSPFSKTMAAFGKYHPLIVHFPIALFLTAAFAQVLNIRSKDGAYDKTVILLVWLGALGALGAGLLGWAHSGPVQIGENTIMSSHRWIGTGLLIGGLIMAYVMTNVQKSKSGLSASKVFNVFLFAMAFGVAVNGFLGGSLAHGGIKHLMPGIM